MVERIRGQVVEAACDGKEKFQSAILAHEVHSRYRPGRQKRHWNVYRCEFCGFYHTGAAARRAERPRRTDDQDESE